jgi:predicted membrane-bound dolichyl-phosphate-mannose-protein mannosyltransferase
LGFGLWRYPTASIAVEALIVIVGAFFYWRAARSVTIAAGTGGRLAASTGLLILLGGLGVLALDAVG